jgi:glycosyltransferase involved in cell wall biosynthesis
MTEKVSVLFVAMDDISGKGGNSVATKDMLSAFVEDSRVSTTAVLPEPQGQLPDDVSGIEIGYIPSLSNKSMKSYAKYSLLSFPVVRRTVRQHDPDIIVARMHPVLIAPAVLASRYGKPYVLLSRGTSYKSLRFSSVLKRIYKMNVRRADEVYTASQEIKQDTDEMRKSRQTEAEVFPNGINPELFEPMSKTEARKRLELGLRDEDFVVGFVGSMGPRHTVDRLIKSVQHINDEIPIKLLLMGGGPKLEDYRKLAEESGLSDKAVFTGFIPHESVSEYVSACDITYGVTEQESATPIKCFEYLACERPLIARDIPELSFVAEEEVGVQIEEIDEGAIADAVEYLYGLEEGERKAMGESGRKYVIENHTWDRLVDMVLEDLSQIPKANIEK